MLCLTQMSIKISVATMLWTSHRIGDVYTMDGKPDLWKIAYYYILECGKTGKKYGEPRALVERPIPGGTDFREIPLRYLTRVTPPGTRLRYRAKYIPDKKKRR